MFQVQASLEAACHASTGSQCRLLFMLFRRITELAQNLKIIGILVSTCLYNYKPTFCTAFDL